MTALTERILLVRPYGIGNAILATPAMQLCRHLRPAARIDALLDPLGAATLGAWRVLDGIHLYPTSPPPEAFDRVLLFEPSSPKVDAPFLEHPGLIRHRLGVRRSARFFHRHEVEVNLELAERLGGAGSATFPLHCDVADPPPDLAPAPGTLGVSLGGTQPQQLAKRFSASFWIDLLRSIAAARPVLLVGWRDEADEAAAIAAAVGAVSVCGKTALPITAGLIRACAVFVATDGGMMHVAACVGTPVVGLFSTTSAWRTRPWTPLGRSIVVEVGRAPSPAEVRRVASAIALLEERGRRWVRLGATGPVLGRSGHWWSPR
jgi:ADP-heptose:LPS heptosyltransferase